jgi:hypothetical protein
LLYDFAKALGSAGQDLRMIETLEKAAEALSTKPDSALSDTQRTLRNAVYNSLTYRYLYIPTQQARDKAIAAADKFLSFSDEDNPGRGAVLVNLACALGQTAATYDVSRRDSKEFLDIRKRALDAVQKAIKSNAAWRDRLRFLLQSDHPDKIAIPENKEENDLEVFENDKDFREAVGLNT